MLNQTITNKTVSVLATWLEDFSKIMWIAFDGTKNMFGHKTSVFAQAEYVHCRSHLSQLASVYACVKVKPIKSLFLPLIACK